MLNINSTIRALIMFLFTLILIANILYAFNINAVIGGGAVGPQVDHDLSGSYFGVSTFLQNWERVYSGNSALQGLGDNLQNIANFMERMSITQAIEANFNGSATSANILMVLGTILDTLINFFYIIGLFIYIFVFMLYIIAVIFSFLSFILTFISGAFTTPLPDTQFPEIFPTMRLVLSYFNEII